MSQVMDNDSLGCVFKSDTEYWKNHQLSTLEQMVQNVQEFRGNHVDMLTNSDKWSGTESPLRLVQQKRIFLARTDVPRKGEILYVDSAGVDDEGVEQVNIIYPERDALDATCEPILNAYQAPAQRVMQVMEADGGWYEVKRFKETGEKVTCPRCGRFLKFSRDHNRMPTTRCTDISCTGSYNTKELVEKDIIKSIW